MKKLYTYVSIGIFFLISITAYSQVPYPQPDQVLIPENFEGTSAAEPVPPGWTFTSSPPIASTTSNPCEGNRSVRALINSTNQNARLRSPIQVASGEDIEISFAYKIIDESGGGATPTTFGSIQLQYSVNANATTPVWANYGVIDGNNHTPSTSCAVSSAIIPGASIPAGSDFAWRIRTNWAAGSYFVYIDDFLAAEQVDCIQPIYVSVDNVTFDEAEIFWTEIGTATEWEIQYGAPNFPPNFNPPFGTIVTTTNEPTTLTGLTDGTEYDVYVRAICGPGDESNWAGPVNFQTIAIGTDCNTPKDITALPYTDTSDTNIYGNSYSGSPGTGCLGNNFLEGNDVVYEFTATADDYLKIALSNLVGEDNVGAFVYESCADIGTTCFAGSTTTDGSNFEFDVFVTTGNTYYIVIATAGTDTTTDYTLDITGFDCLSWNAPDGDPSYEFFGQQLSAFDDTSLGVQKTNDFAELNWYEDNAGVQGALIPDTSTITLTDGDVFWVNQSLGTCDSPSLMVTFNEFDCLNELEVLTTDAGDEICGEGTTILSATADTDDLFWYDNEFGGEVRGTGNTFETDIIDLTTSYWVGEAFVGQGTLSGQANPGPSTVSTSTINNRGVIVDNISSDFTLVNVQVFSTGGGGAMTVELIELSGNLPTQTVTVSIPSGSTASPTPYTVPLNFELVSGASYRLLKTNGTGPSMIYSTGANSNFPYAVGNVAEITDGATATGTLTSYYFFYNWTITEDQPLCESPRTEVIAVVNEIFDVTASAVSNTVCVNQNATLDVTSVDSDYVYTWEWNDPSGAPQTDTGAQITPTIVQTTTFTVTGFNPITGCTSPEESVTIEAIGAGEIPVTPEEIETCVGNIVELFAGGVYNTFEDQVTNWTVANSSTGPGTPADAAWKLVNSPYSPADGATSNDNSQFYIATADEVGPSGTVNTQLTSESFNLVGVQNATLTFHHYYRHISTQSTTARVQVSVGNGPWSNLATYNSDQGTATDFNFVTVDLSSYTGAADVRVRFDYTGSWGWWWAVDNVTIARDYTNGEVTWSSVNNLFLDADATIPYTGSSTNKVYFKSDTPGTFTYEVELDIFGCAAPVTNNVIITVNETLAPTGAALQDYITGETLASLNVTGQNLQYYILENGEYIQISPNFLLQHGTTYYITQTSDNCESEFLEVTVNLDCPAPTNVEVNVELGAGGSSASGIVTWTEPAVTSSIQGYYVEVRDANNDVIFDQTVSATTDFVVFQGLALNEDFTAIVYAICDSTIPVFSAEETVPFNTNQLSTADFNFDGFTFYPNPTSDIVTFENKLPIKNLEVFSINGQKLIEMNHINTTTVEVNFESFASGVYFAAVTVGESVEIVRIIRQ